MYMGHEIAQQWRLKDQRYSLIGERCPHCDNKIFPPRDICNNCGEKAKELYQFSGKGEVYSSTVIYEAPSGYESFAPYQVALVKLDEGSMVTARLTDLPDPTKLVEIGTRVVMVTRKIKEDGEEGLFTYGYMFRLPIGASSPTEVSTSSK